jgi:hypothetical protein
MGRPRSISTGTFASGFAACSSFRFLTVSVIRRYASPFTCRQMRAFAQNGESERS